MHAERTPNPDSVKWVVSAEVTPDAGFIGFTDADEAAPSSLAPSSLAPSPLAASLLGVEGVVQVFLGPDFITVSKRPEVDWAELAQPVVERIKAWAESGEPAVEAGYAAGSIGDEEPVVARIREILERDIRPYVAQDGGEIGFAGYSDGVVKVHLRGACAGCPSSTVTLKMGIEARLKEELPEVHSVVAV
jgi:Fe-S cluster biogenesis protein NfuA